jgi:hypothetical protein
MDPEDLDIKFLGFLGAFSYGKKIMRLETHKLHTPLVLASNLVKTGHAVTQFSFSPKSMDIKIQRKPHTREDYE